MNSKVRLYKWSSMFLLFFFSVSLLKAQTSQQQKVIDEAKIKCTYLLKYQKDSTDKKSVAFEQMLLLIGDSVSQFQSLNAYLRDSVMRVSPTNNMAVAMSQLSQYRTGFLYQLLKNYPDGRVSYIERVFRDYFLVEHSMDIFDWKIATDTATILGYHCQKATTHFAGRDYEAWFTLEIPISEGPYKFNGLPGLIVKVADTRKQYVFQLSGLQQVSTSVPIEFPEKDYIKTTQKKFNQAKRQFLDNFESRLAQKGITIHLSNKEIKKKLKRNANNAIEIDDEND